VLLAWPIYVGLEISQGLPHRPVFWSLVLGLGFVIVGWVLQFELQLRVSRARWVGRGFDVGEKKRHSKGSVP
jgi:hypothetical protein